MLRRAAIRTVTGKLWTSFIRTTNVRGSGSRSVILVRAGHVGWVSLNVNRSVSAWLQSSARVAGRRLDLRVVVSDARSSRTTIDAFDVFHAPNCSVAQLQPSRPGTL